MERKRQPVSSVRKHRVSLGKRRDSRSHLAVPNDPDANPCGLSSADFLATMERSGILSETGLQEVRDCLVQDRQLQDSSVLAERLVKQGRLTEFQARRLLVGKAKSLVFGRYVLLDRLGIGAMGRVFKARHRLMDRLVALKVVLPGCATSKHSVSRFFREMKIVGVLDHPNVVRAFDADQQEDSPYIVMEYLEGEDLEKVLRRRGMLPPHEVIDCMIQVARGLAHAHEKGWSIGTSSPPTSSWTTRGSSRFSTLDWELSSGSRTKERVLKTPTKALWSGHAITCRPSSSRGRRSMRGRINSVSAAPCTGC